MYIKQIIGSNIIEHKWLNIRKKVYVVKCIVEKNIYKCTYYPIVYPYIESLKIGSYIEAKHFKKLRVSRYGELIHYNNYKDYDDSDGWYKVKIIDVKDNHIIVQFSHNNLKK